MKKSRLIGYLRGILQPLNIEDMFGPLSLLESSP